MSSTVFESRILEIRIHWIPKYMENQMKPNSAERCDLCGGERWTESLYLDRADGVRVNLFACAPCAAAYRTR